MAIEIVLIFLAVISFIGYISLVLGSARLWSNITSRNPVPVLRVHIVYSVLNKIGDQLTPRNKGPINTLGYTCMGLMLIMTIMPFVYLYGLLYIKVQHITYTMYHSNKSKYNFTAEWLEEKQLFTMQSFIYSRSFNRSLDENLINWLNENKINYKFCPIYGYFSISNEDVMAFKLRWM